MTADHPHEDPGDGRQECWLCGKWVFPVIHSCKRVPVTPDAELRCFGNPDLFVERSLAYLRGEFKPWDWKDEALEARGKW
jgi:hypothetical protein